MSRGLDLRAATRNPLGGRPLSDAAARDSSMTPETLNHPRARAGARLALAAVYAGIGVVHVSSPDAFLPIMPDWVPHPRDVVLATGVCELAGSVALLTPRLRRAAGWAFAAYAVCVFPANIKHAIDNVNVPPIRPPGGTTARDLPFSLFSSGGLCGRPGSSIGRSAAGTVWCPRGIRIMAKAAHGTIRIGVGGWTFEPWRGLFFPDGLPHKRELEYASSKLTSIEVNGTFYRSQTPATFAKWRDETPDGFVFALKAPRFATTRRVLAEAGPSDRALRRKRHYRAREQAWADQLATSPDQSLRSSDTEAFLSLFAQAGRRTSASSRDRGSSRQLPRSGLRRPGPPLWCRDRAGW